MEREQYTLQKFIHDEMGRRDMSARQFADLMDVAHTTLNRVLNEKDPSSPTIEFLTKLAQATKRSLGSIVEMAYPELAESTRPGASTIILAQNFEELPDDLKAAVMTILRNRR